MAKLPVIIASVCLLLGTAPSTNAFAESPEDDAFCNTSVVGGLEAFNVALDEMAAQAVAQGDETIAIEIALYKLEMQAPTLELLAEDCNAVDQPSISGWCSDEFHGSAKMVFCAVSCGLFPTAKHYSVYVSAVNPVSNEPPVYAGESCAGAHYYPAPAFGISCAGTNHCNANYPEGVALGIHYCIWATWGGSAEFAEGQSFDCS